MSQVPSNDCKLCMTSVGELVVAQKIARTLLQQKLVACVNISSKMLSLYHWQGQLVEESEYVLYMKTNAINLQQLGDTLKTIHPYEVAEFIVFDIESGNPDYLNWINSVLA